MAKHYFQPTGLDQWRQKLQISFYFPTQDPNSSSIKIKSLIRQSLRSGRALIFYYSVRLGLFFLPVTLLPLSLSYLKSVAWSRCGGCRVRQQENSRHPRGESGTCGRNIRFGELRCFHILHIFHKI